MSGLDWPGLMRAGLGGLGLLPADFWDLTPLELIILLGPQEAAMGMNRSGLEALMSRFPDAVNAAAATPSHETGGIERPAKSHRPKL